MANIKGPDKRSCVEKMVGFFILQKNLQKKLGHVCYWASQKVWQLLSNLAKKEMNITNIITLSSIALSNVDAWSTQWSEFCSAIDVELCQ